MPKDQPVQLPIESSEIAMHGKIWDVVRERFVYGSESLTREFVAHPGAVAVVAFDEEQRVLLIRQYRHPVRSYLWEIPAGLLDVTGESLETAARRELLEETGYEAEELTLLTRFMTTPGGNSEVIYIYLAQGLKHVGYELGLSGEEVDMQVEWFPLPEVLDSVLSADMQSPSAVVGVMALAHKLGMTGGTTTVG